MNELNIAKETEKAEDVELPEEAEVEAEETKEPSKEADTEVKEAEAQQKKSPEKSFGEYTVDELYALAEEHPSEDVTSDIMSEPFKIFAKQRRGSMGDTYSEFLAMKKAFEKAVPARGKSGQDEKRAYSGFGDAPSRDPSAGLTRRQMEIARDAGMSYREYAFLLESLPDKRIR